MVKDNRCKCESITVALTTQQNMGIQQMYENTEDKGQLMRDFLEGAKPTASFERSINSCMEI